MILFYLLILAIFLIRNRGIALTLLCLLLLCLLQTGYQNYFSFDLKITQIDVRQGDAILIQSAHKNVLIDTGGNRFSDTSSLSVIPYLKYLWLDRLDLVILTHSDIDHFGNFKGIMDSFKIGEVWVNNQPPTDPIYQDVVRTIQDRGIPLRVVEDEFSITLDQHTEMRVLAPFEKGSGVSDDNDHSVVVKVRHKDFSALFTGDISTRAEDFLIERYSDALESDYLKVAHHGSRTSTGQRFLDAVKPRWASIGVDEKSAYGHPHPAVIKRLERRGAVILRTDLHGAAGLVIKKGVMKPWSYLQRDPPPPGEKP